jgi:hypothetical protein
MISSFFKTRKAKQFNFQARYYDENKEELRERYERIKQEMGGQEFSSAGRHVDFKSQWQARKKTSHFESKSNVRLLIIFGVLCALCYYILFL